jgi:hypothetical protein
MFTARVTDSEHPTPVSVSEPVTVTIAPRRLTVITSRLPSAKVGVAYSQALVAAMGLQPLSWRITAGRLTAGLTLSAQTGAITGTPTQTGTSTFTVRVTDATKPAAMTATANLSITVNPNVQAAVYVTEGGYSGVQSFPVRSSGNVKPTTSVTGPTTGLDGTAAVVIDPVSGTLYVASAGNEQIAEFPYGATGRVAPSAVISGGATGLAYPMALALDGSDRLYVANHSSNSVTVYAPGAAGNAKPVATISGQDTGLLGPAGLTLDPAGHLWVANSGADSLTEYAAGATGDARPLATSFTLNKNYHDLEQVAEWLPAFSAVRDQITAAGRYPYNDSFKSRVPGITGPCEDTAIDLLQGLYRQREQTARVQRALAEGFEPIESVSGVERLAPVIVYHPDRSGEWREYVDARLVREHNPGQAAVIGPVHALLPKGKRTRGVLIGVTSTRVLVNRNVR